VRTVLTVIDGIVAGEGEGPLAPAAVPLGVILAATDPVALDLAAVRLMGFDEARLPKLREPMAQQALRVTEVRSPADVVVREVDGDRLQVQQKRLDDLEAVHAFVPHPGWQGRVERDPT